MKPNILAFSEIIWDIYSDRKVIGGAGLNFAAHCRKCGANSYIFSAVGNDDLGQSAKEITESFNVDCSLLQRVDKKTGQCIVELDKSGVPSFNVLSDVAYDNITLSEDVIADINNIGFDVLYFGSLIQRSGVSRASLKTLCEKCSFSEIVCDINLRKNCYDGDSIKFCLENATILKISDEEEPVLRSFGLYTADNETAESICKAIATEFSQLKYIIFTLGAKGAFVFNCQSGEGFSQSAQAVEVVSTVGAGDSFIAAWITRYQSGQSVQSATKQANALAAFVVMNTAAIPSYIIDGDTIKPVVKIYDMHVHSQNSHDSNARIADIAKVCVEKNISAFAVTDHCDVQYYIDRDMPSCIKGSIEEVEQVAKEFEGKIEIYKGIEIGEGIWDTVHTSEILSKHDYDVVIGSVHAVRYKDYTDPYSTIDFSDWTEKEIYEYLQVYFEEVLQMVQTIPCDIMAHLTCPLSYIKGKYNKNADATKYKDKISEILRYIIENNIAMEINASRFDTPYGVLMPDGWIIKQFREMGGYLVTLGSDAHVPENAGKDLDKAIEALRKYGFDGYYYYKNRKSIKCHI